MSVVGREVIEGRLEEYVRATALLVVYPLGAIMGLADARRASTRTRPHVHRTMGGDGGRRRGHGAGVMRTPREVVEAYNFELWNERRSEPR
jgi:hypothetical protein